MEKAEFLKKIDRITDLPTLPETAIEVNRLLDNPGATIDQLSETIKKDQAIVGKMLRLVNSSFFGMPAKVGTVPRAVVILGFNTVRNALISVSIIDSFNKFKGGGIDMKAFWLHSISCAVVGKQLALQTGLCPPEEVFTSGIVHDIGKLVLAKYFPSEFFIIMESAAKGLSFFDAEAPVIPVHHNIIGEYLALRWHLPKNITDAIRFSHSKKNLDEYPVANLVRCAGTIVTSGWLDTEDSAAATSRCCSILQTLGLTIEDRQQWKTEMNSEIESACRFLLEGG